MDEATQRLIVEQASQFREVLVGESRSTVLSHLLDYLLERSADRRAPKEIEIAMAVFGKTAEFDTSQDSTVRAHIYRLRQRLHIFNAGKSGMLLEIPKGEYRLILTDEPKSVDEDEAPSLRLKSRNRQKRIRVMVIAGFVATAVFWSLLFLKGGLGGEALSPLSKSPFWQPVATHERLPLIAVGDFYLVVQSGPEDKVQRLAMHPTIRSGRDLDDYLRMHPDQYSKLHDRDIHRIPARVATGATAILPLVAGMRSDHGVPDIIPVSRISQETIDSRNVIYIGYFAELGELRSPVLRQSRFEPGADFNELKDNSSGKVFRARAAPSTDISNSRGPTKDPFGYDYGYIASYPGPSGNQTIVISGIDDAALSQMIRLVSDKKQLDVLAKKTGGQRLSRLSIKCVAQGTSFSTHSS
ncbi:hypothetical protein [Rhizorhapis sp. SPR117]|uniref:hypothetical protein n=1 Tax=Rhizorhapis sp. SPR117 TaxID=2912611 RepID=UPI001F1DD822|nr:hypothetical protein [Rhizorhapis sp. SPR117]